MAEKSSKPSGFLETVGVAPASGRRPGASLGDAGGRPRLTIARNPRAAAAGQEPPASRRRNSRRFEVRFQRADLIVDMPFPASQCLVGVVRRSLLGFGRRRPDTATGCPERFDLKFYRWVWSFERDSRPTLEATVVKARSAAVRTVTLRGRAYAAEFLAQS